MISPFCMFIYYSKVADLEGRGALGAEALPPNFYYATLEGTEQVQLNLNEKMERVRREELISSRNQQE